MNTAQDSHALTYGRKMSLPRTIGVDMFPFVPPGEVALA